MKQYVGIWIDTKHAVIIKLFDNKHSIKKVESRIETRERILGETKKFGRFGRQYLTFEKNRLNKKKAQTHTFFRSLLKEVNHCDGIVIFGPARMKHKFERELKNNMLYAEKIKGIHNSELITDNQMVAWVKDFYKVIV